MSALRAILYMLARLLGDAQAVKRGRVGQRVANRMIGRAVGKATRRLWR
jgi:hypothetical protein